MVGHLQSCYSFGATNSTFFPCPVSIKCRPKHRYSWSRGCMFLVHMWHVAVVADGIFACKDMKLEKYLVVHPRGAVGQVINRPILFSSLNLQVAHLWQNRLGGKQQAFSNILIAHAVPAHTVQGGQPGLLGQAKANFSSFTNARQSFTSYAAVDWTKS